MSEEVRRVPLIQFQTELPPEKFVENMMEIARGIMRTHGQFEGVYAFYYGSDNLWYTETIGVRNDWERGREQRFFHDKAKSLDAQIAVVIFDSWIGQPVRKGQAHNYRPSEDPRRRECITLQVFRPDGSIEVKHQLYRRSKTRIVWEKPEGPMKEIMDQRIYHSAWHPWDPKDLEKEYREAIEQVPDEEETSNG